MVVAQGSEEMGDSNRSVGNKRDGGEDNYPSMNVSKTLIFQELKLSPILLVHEVDV